MVKIDVPRSLLYVKGPVPGPIGGLVRIRDAHYKHHRQYRDLYYPTWLASEHPEDALMEKLIWKGPEDDPLENYRHENDLRAGKDDDDD